LTKISAFFYLRFAFSVIWIADRFAHLDCLERVAFLGVLTKKTDACAASVICYLLSDNTLHFWELHEILFYHNLKAFSDIVVLYANFFCTPSAMAGAFILGCCALLFWGIVF
jgi:hypothetical protein